MRLKHRVYVCQLEFAADAGGDAAALGTTPSAVFAAVKAAALDAFGDAGWAALAGALAVKYYSPATRVALVRGPGALDGHVRAALALVTAVGGAPAAVRTLQVSASARTLRAYVAHAHARAVSALRRDADAGGLALDDAFLDALAGDVDDAVNSGGVAPPR